VGPIGVAGWDLDKDTLEYPEIFAESEIHG